MILDSKAGVRGVLVRADTGERIPHARWANIPDDPHQVGEFVALVCNLAGQPVKPVRTYRGRCRLRFIPSLAPALKPVPTDAPAATPATVPAVQTPVPAPAPPPASGQRVGLNDAARRCEHSACDRLATWKTAEEQELPAVVDGSGKQWERAKKIRTRWWCEWHYQWPTLRHLDGEVEQVEVKARPE